MTKLVQSLLFCLISALSYGAMAQATAPAGKEASKPAASKPAPSSASAPASSPAAKPADQLLDINSASEKELAELPKIGEARAKAIVAGRPYSGKDDLLRKKIIPKDAYAAIKDKVIARQGAKSDNKASAKSDAKADAKADKKADAKADKKADAKTDGKK